jgi:PAS domain S-box-containing protein
MGRPNVFIRTTGCNLRCSYCDTTYSYEYGIEKSIEEILKEVSTFHCKHICVTGGEPLIQKHIEDLLKEGKLLDTEILFKKKDGTPFWAIASSRITYDENGNVESLNGYVYDINERTKALDLLRDSEEMFRQLSDNLRNAVYMFNNEGRFVYANNATSEITGYSVDELLTMKFYEIVHPDYVDVVKDRGFDRIHGDEPPRTYEFKILTKQGAEIWLEITASLMNLKGEPVVIGTGADVTERKQAIRKIKQNEQKYKSLYTFFRLLSDNNPDLIWAKDIAGKYIFVNKSTCQNLLLAEDTEEPIGKK